VTCRASALLAAVSNPWQAECLPYKTVVASAACPDPSRFLPRILGPNPFRAFSGPTSGFLHRGPQLSLWKPPVPALRALRVFVVNRVRHSDFCLPCCFCVSVLDPPLPFVCLLILCSTGLSGFTRFNDSRLPASKNAGKACARKYRAAWQPSPCRHRNG